MHIGINWECLGNTTDAKELLYLLKQNGFSATFPLSDHPELDRILPLIKQEGIVCEAMHAPFGGINRMWGDGGEEILAKLQKGVYACAKHDVPVLVVHLSSGDNAPQVNDRGMERYSLLMEEARREGITVAYENQRKLGNIAVAMEAFPEAGFCWDVGHEECFTYGREYMPLFGDRIVALHLHDNPCGHDQDHHMLPYDGSIDLHKKAKRLAESGYSKAIMLEVFQAGNACYRSLSAEQFLSRAASAARRFAAEVEQFRAER